jgi:rod shape-determining protein MreC
MAVITAGGIVGKVLRVYPSTSLVLLINDQSSGVGVILQKSRLQGVLAGTPNGEVVMKEVMSDEQVSPGESLLTSGGDQIFPKGLPVGTIAKVGAAKDLFLSITVKPSANLDRLEEVLVVLRKQEKQVVTADAPRARAADILAQRLPSVPDQPAAVATTPSGGTSTSGVKATSAVKATAPAPGAQAGHAEASKQTPVRTAANSVGGAKPVVADPPPTSKKAASPGTTPQTVKPQDSVAPPKTSAPQSETPPASDADTPH